MAALTDNLVNRLEIISNSNFLSGSAHWTTKSRIKFNYFLGGLMLFLIISLVAFISYSAIAGLFGFTGSSNWKKSELFVLYSLIIYKELNQKIYSLILLRHLRNIEKSKITDVEASLNMELEEIITDLNQPQRNVMEIALAVLIVIGVFLHATGDNPYWNYFLIPTLLFFVLVSVVGVRNIRKLKKNILKSEGELLVIAQ